MDRENYYILLELSPSEKNSTIIEQAIKKKQAEWSKLRNHPTKGRLAQKNLASIPNIQKVLQDSQLRQLEASEAKKILAQQTKEKFKELDETIKVLSRKGHLLDTEVSKLIKQFPSLSEAEIRPRIRVPIQKADNQQKQNKKTQPLDKTTLKVINDNLAIIHQKNLYDFLQLSPTSSLSTLQTTTTQQDAELKKIAHKDAELTAKTILIGHCQNIFKTAELRDAYDASLAYAHISELDNLINRVGGSGIIQLVVYEELLKKAVSIGLSKQDAQDYIIAACRKKGWAIEMPAQSNLDEMPQCGVCGTLNAKSNKNCENCGYPLKVTCPQCNHSNPSIAKVCTHCGFAIGDMPNAQRLIREAQLALATQQLDDAESLFKQANVYYPNHPNIKTGLQQINAAQQAVQAKQAETNQLVKNLHNAINQKHYYQARTLLFDLKQQDNNHPELAQNRLIEQKIQAAETWLNKARTLSNTDQQLDAYLAALNEVADCQAALSAMTKLPPEPPQNAQASPFHSGIAIRWLPTSSKGEITYKIVRKVAVFPNNPSDGPLMSETAQTTFDDSSAEIGEEYCYAVYAVRGNTCSVKASQAGPVMRISDIEEKHLTLIPADNSIQMQWQVPAKTYEIEIWRKQNSPPLRRGDGEKLKGVRMNGVTDTNLKNDTSYGYLILLVFQDKQGRKIYSTGLTKHATPTTPPQPLSHFNMNRQGNTLEITWTPPSKGHIELFISSQPPTFKSGERIAAVELNQLGQAIPVNQPHQTRYTINFQGEKHITPVTVQGEVAVVGISKTITSFQDVTQLRANIRYHKLYLEWDWTQEIDKVLVSYRHDTYPQDAQDPNATLSLITQQQYRSKGSAFVINQPENKTYYFKVFVVAETPHKTLYSSGCLCSISNRGYEEIYYEIKLKKGFFGQVKAVQLSLSASESVVIPETVLIEKFKSLPLRRSDGKTILTISAGTSIENNVLIEIPLSEAKKDHYAKLFLVNATDNERYRLIPASKNKLKLG